MHSDMKEEIGLKVGDCVKVRKGVELHSFKGDYTNNYTVDRIFEEWGMIFCKLLEFEGVGSTYPIRVFEKVAGD